MNSCFVFFIYNTYNKRTHRNYVGSFMCTQIVIGLCRKDVIIIFGGEIFDINSQESLSVVDFLLSLADRWTDQSSLDSHVVSAPMGCYRCPYLKIGSNCSQCDQCPRHATSLDNHSSQLPNIRPVYLEAKIENTAIN